MTITHYYLVVISFILGIFCATLFAISYATLVWFMGGALVSALLCRRFYQSKSKIFYLRAGLILAFFVFGAVRFNVAFDSYGHSKLANMLGKEVVLSGVVVKEPEVREKSKYLYIEAEEDLLLVTTDRYQEVTYGDIVTVSGQLTKPEEFTTDFGRTFDYPGYLLAKGVEYRVSLASVTVTGRDAGNFFIAHLLNFKSAFLNNISSYISEPAAGLGAGLLLGVKQALGEKLEMAFRETGIIHIVVLSGYNVMLVVIFIMHILGYLIPQRPRVVVGLVTIVAFALLVGLSSTVVRACLMASLVLIVQVTGRTYLALRALMLTAVLMLMLNPMLLVYDVGFQLSFLATMGLILVSPLLGYWFRLVPNNFGLRGFIVATIATQIAVLPLLLYQIGQFSLVSIIVNVLVLPMVPVAMLMTFVTGLTAFISPSLAGLLAIPTYFSLNYINELALWFAELPFASLVVPAFSFYFVPLAYACMAYLLFRFFDLNSKLSSDQEGEVKVKFDSSNYNLSDWTIEEELDKSVKSHLEQHNNKTPIFFR